MKMTDPFAEALIAEEPDLAEQLVQDLNTLGAIDMASGIPLDIESLAAPEALEVYEHAWGVPIAGQPRWSSVCLACVDFGAESMSESAKFFAANGHPLALFRHDLPVGDVTQFSIYDLQEAVGYFALLQRSLWPGISSTSTGQMVWATNDYDGTALWVQSDQPMYPADPYSLRGRPWLPVVVRPDDNLKWADRSPAGILTWRETWWKVEPEMSFDWAVQLAASYDEENLVEWLLDETYLEEIQETEDENVLNDALNNLALFWVAHQMGESEASGADGATETSLFTLRPEEKPDLIASVKYFFDEDPSNGPRKESSAVSQLTDHFSWGRLTPERKTKVSQFIEGVTDGEKSDLDAIREHFRACVEQYPESESKENVQSS